MLEKDFALDPVMCKRLIAVVGTVPDTYLFISVPFQTLSLIEHQRVSVVYPVSTSKFGTGNQENSFKTPLGVHKIAEKIGGGTPLGHIFKSRKDTGEYWRGEISEENLILSRILWLSGLEPGINHGPGIDSYERYVYIHGTNQERFIGTPTSHGCVCMKNTDIIELFDKAPEGTIVIIS